MSTSSEPGPVTVRRPRIGRATMIDVAALAGVSLKSVSRVVNRESGVSAQLSARVDEAVRQLGYRHNLAASNLRRGVRTQSIGMLVQDLSNAYCSEVLRVVEDRARERGVVVLASSVDEDEKRERQLISEFVARRIDGLILMPTSDDLSWLQQDLDAGFVVVSIDRTPRRPPVDGVVADNRGASATAVEHLIAHGHTRIAFLGDRLMIPTATDRRAGYHDALRSVGLSPRPDYERTELWTREAARVAAVEVMSQPDPPTAVFAAHNLICEGTVLALRDLGLSERVAVVGFDDSDLAEMISPAVTVIRQDTREIGGRAMDLLLARLGGDTSPPRVETVASTLVIRGSGEIRPPG